MILILLINKNKYNISQESFSLKSSDIRFSFCKTCSFFILNSIKIDCNNNTIKFLSDNNGDKFLKTEIKFKKFDINEKINFEKNEKKIIF